MSSLESYAKAIAKKLKPAMDKAEEPKAQRDIFGTASVSSSGASVLIDGSSEPVKCHFSVNCLDGDRVVCHIVNHRVVVVSNLTNPNLSTAEAITHAKASPNTVVVQNVVLSDSTLQNVDLHGFYATDGTIENTFIKGSDIDGSTFTNGSISGTSIDTSTFTNGSISGAAIDASTFTNGQISGAAIDASTFTNGQISGAAIDTSTFTNGSISGAAIDASTFTNGSISGAAIDGSTFTNGQISGAAIDSSTLTNIPFASIDDVEIDTAQIKDGAITTAKIKDGNITTAKIGDAQVTNAKIGSAAVGTANIQTAAITTALIANEAVVDSQILSVSANKLTAGTIDASKINVANLKAENLIVRTINGQPVLGGYALIDPSSTGYSSKNPQTEGWYEIANGAYVLTTDTSVVDGKAYYALGTAVMLYDQTYINGLADQLNGRIDGTIESFTGTVVPTLVNYPYTDWYKPSANPPVDVRDEHVGDIYYVVNSGGASDGYCYRFAKSGSGSGATYSWVLIKDSDVTAALAYFGDMSTLGGEFTVASFATATATELSNTQNAISTIRTDIGDHSNYTTNSVAQQLYENSATITSLTDTVLHGGENLLSDSASIDLAEPPFSNSTATAYGTTKYGGEQAYYCSGSKYVRVDFSGLTAGDKYTFSFDATRSNAQDVYVTYNGASTNLGKTSSTSGEWKRFSHTFTAVSGQNYILVQVYTASSSGSANYVASFRNFKLEYGKLATPYEMDVFRTANTVNTVSQTATSNSSIISQLTTTLGTNEDGTTAANDVVHRVTTTETNLNGITTRVSATEAQIKGQFATSSTGASTAAKTATITPTNSSWTRATGSTVTVKFTTANTASSPTLNINSTGAASIRNYAGSALTEAEYKWPAGAAMTFTFDGTYWRIQDSTELTRLSSAESSITQNADKISMVVDGSSTSSSLVLTDKAINAITNQFEVTDSTGTSTIISGGKIQANSLTIGSIDMNDSATTAAIANSSLATDISNAAATATNYITADSSGIKLHDAGDTSNYAHITSSGTEVYKGGTSVAGFGETARIGAANSSRFIMDEDELAAYDSDGNQYFNVSEDRLVYGGRTAANTDDLAGVSFQVKKIIDGLQSSNYTTFTQTGDTFSFEFTKLNNALGAIESYVHIQDDVMTLGSTDKPVCAQLSSDGLVFYPIIDVDGEREIDKQNPIASLVIEGSGDSAQGVLVIHRAVVVNELRFGDWAWTPRPGTGNLSLKWIGA